MKHPKISLIAKTLSHETSLEDSKHENSLSPKPFEGGPISKEPRDKEFLTPKMLVEDPSCPFSEKALRFHIWRSGVNGLAPAIFRIGKKILIKRTEWIRWIEGHSQQKKGGRDNDRKTS